MCYPHPPQTCENLAALWGWRDAAGEIRGERVRAGQAAARAAGKTWGGSKKGKWRKVTEEQIGAIITMKANGVEIARIARIVNLSRLTVYRVLERYEQDFIDIAG